MGVLQRFERRLEGLVSGAFTRLFKGKVEPVEIAASLQRETDDNKTVVGEGRILVPNDFVVGLGATDYERLSPYARPLGAELADMVSEHAAEQGYSFVGPVQVTLEEDDSLDTGRFLVRSGVAAGDAAPAAVPVQSREPGPAAASPAGAGARVDDTAWAQAVAWLLVQPRTGPAQSVALPGPVATIGRGVDCDVRLDDTGVSRRHAEIRLTGGVATITDLRSTNGTTVNGKRVTTRKLADGDRLLLGGTALTYRRDQP